VLHVALRMPRSSSLVVDGVDVVAHVHEALDRMADFANYSPVADAEIHDDESAAAIGVLRRG
jgi:hypothetical protein